MDRCMESHLRLKLMPDLLGFHQGLILLCRPWNSVSMLQHGMLLSLPWIRRAASEGEEEIHWQTETLNPVLRFLSTLHVSLCLPGSVSSPWLGGNS